MLVLFKRTFNIPRWLYIEFRTWTSYNLLRIGRTGERNALHACHTADSLMLTDSSGELMRCTCWTWVHWGKNLFSNSIINQPGRSKANSSLLSFTFVIFILMTAEAWLGFMERDRQADRQRQRLFCGVLVWTCTRERICFQNSINRQLGCWKYSA